MFMLIFWIPALLVLYLVLRDESGSNRNYGGGKGSKSALDILNEKYANGEMDSEEYESRKRKLNN